MVNTTNGGIGFVGTQSPAREKKRMEMVRYKELDKLQQEAALIIECQIILNDLKSQDYATLRKFDPRMVSDFKYLGFCIQERRDPQIIRNLKSLLSKLIVSRVCKVIFANYYPKHLDPAKVYTMLITHPSQPYRSFII